MHFFSKKCNLPWKKLLPSFPVTPPSKLRSRQAPPFWKFGRRFTPPQRKRGVAHYVISHLTLSCLMLKNDQTYFKNWGEVSPQDFYSMFGHFSKSWMKGLTLWEPTPQNSQTHSNNSSATPDELFECVWPFCGVGA